MEGTFVYQPTDYQCGEACSLFAGEFFGSDYCPEGRLEASLNATGCVQSYYSLKEQQDLKKEYLETTVRCAEIGGRAPIVKQANGIPAEMVTGFSHAIESPSP